LFEALVTDGSESVWEQVDAWAISQYGLSHRDLQVIRDTLSFNLPFADSRKASQTPPTRLETTAFCQVLTSELNPWAQRLGKRINARPVSPPAVSPWEVIQVGTALAPDNPPYQGWPEILRVADQLAASEVIHPDAAAGCLWLARLNQARYWSHSQARLVARRITWEHLNFLLGLTAQ
jgi:hypothetical protein